MRKGIVLAAVLCFSANAAAQTVVLYKCSDGSDVPIYQSEPCPATQEMTGVVEDSVYRSPARARAIQQQRQNRQAGTRYLERLANRSRQGEGVLIPTNPTRVETQCEIARAQRERYRKAGHGTYESRDRLDDAVMRACY